jgi:Flp pilus assembly pilin Flp
MEDLLMKNLFKSFLKKDSGAISTEYYVLAAAVVALCVAAYTNIEHGSDAVVNVDPDAALNKFVEGF